MLSTVIAASDHPTRAVYFAAITIFNAQAAVIEVTASSGGVGGTEPTYQFSDLSAFDGRYSGDADENCSRVVLRKVGLFIIIHIRRIEFFIAIERD